MMRRNSDHVYQFMMAELGTEGSIDGNKRLVIRGKFVPKVGILFQLLGIFEDICSEFILVNSVILQYFNYSTLSHC